MRGVKVALSEEIRKNMLNWMPVIGEVYVVQPDVTLPCFDSLQGCLESYCIGESKNFTQEKRPENRILHSKTSFLILEHLMPKLTGEPAVVSVLSIKDNNKFWFVIYPPMTAVGAQVWNMLFTNLSNEK